MRWTLRGLITAAVFVIPVVSTLPAHAEGGEEGDSPDTTSQSSANPGHSSSKTKKAAKGEKETDGTTAPNRFEADTVIKSQYKHEGEQLEVDPD